MALPVQHTVRTNNTVGSASLSTGGTLSMSQYDIRNRQINLSTDYKMNSIINTIIHNVKTMVELDMLDIEYIGLYDITISAIGELPKNVDKLSLRQLVLVHTILGRIPVLQDLFVSIISFGGIEETEETVPEYYKPYLEELMKDIKKKILRTGKT